MKTTVDNLTHSPHYAGEGSVKTTTLSLWDFLHSLKNYNGDVVRIREIKTQLSSTSDISLHKKLESEARRLKTNLPMVYSVTFTKVGHVTRDYVDESSLRIMIFDFDKIDADTIKRLKEACSTLQGVAGAFISPSGEGLKVLLRLEGLTFSNWDAHYYACASFFYSQYNVKADILCRNINRGCFSSYDPDVYISNTDQYFNQYIQDYINTDHFEAEDTEKAVRVPKSKTKSDVANQIPLNTAIDIPQNIQRKIDRGIRQRYTNTTTMEGAISLIRETVKSYALTTSDNSGRHAKLFYKMIIQPLRLGVPPGILYDAIRTVVKEDLPQLNDWLLSKNLLRTIEYAHEKYCKGRLYNIPTCTSQEYKYDVQINLKKYMTEAQSEFNSYFDKYEKIFIHSPTGSGKTRMITDYCVGELFTALEKEDAEYDLPKLDFPKQTLIVFPNTITAVNVYEGLKRSTKIRADVKQHIALVTGEHPLELNDMMDYRSPWLTIAVVDQLPNIIRYAKKVKLGMEGDAADVDSMSGLFNMVVADEIHKFESDTTFRSSIAHISDFFESGVKLIMMTATPSEGILHWCDLINAYSIKAHVDKKQTYNVTLEQNFTDITIARDILSEVAKGKKVICRCGSLAMIDLLKNEILNQRGETTIMTITADSKNEMACMRFAKSGDMVQEVILCTKVLEDGFSIRTEGDFTIMYHCSSAEVMDPNAVKQMAARARKPSEVDVKIYCQLHNKYKAHAEQHAFIEESYKRLTAMINTVAITPYKTDGVSINLPIFSKLFSSVVRNHGRINALALTHCISQNALRNKHNQNLVVHALSELFETEVKNGGGEVITDDEKGGYKARVKEEKERKRKTVEEFIEKLSDIGLFKLFYTANAAMRKYKNLPYREWEFNTPQKAKNELLARKYSEVDIHSTSLNNFLSFYNAISQDVTNHDEKMALIRRLSKPEDRREFMKRRGAIIVAGGRVDCRSEVNMSDYALEELHIDAIKDFIKEYGVFNAGAYCKWVSNRNGGRFQFDIYCNIASQLFSASHISNRVRKRLNPDDKIYELLNDARGASILYTDCVEIDKKMVIEIYSITESLSAELFDIGEEATDIKERIAEAKKHVLAMDLTGITVANVNTKLSEIFKFELDINKKREVFTELLKIKPPIKVPRSGRKPLTKRQKEKFNAMYRDIIKDLTPADYLKEFNTMSVDEQIDILYAELVELPAEIFLRVHEKSGALLKRLEIITPEENYSTLYEIIIAEAERVPRHLPWLNARIGAPKWYGFE